MKLSALLAPLLDAKADHETIRLTILAFEAEQIDALEKRRESDRKRQADKRGRDASHVTSRDVTVTGSSHAPAARVEDNLLPKKISGQEENKQDAARKARVSDLAEFKAELSELDNARLEAIIKHRKAKRGQLTGHAAKLFRRDASECRMTIVDAVDACISRNWITVKPEYFAGRGRPSSTAPPPAPRNPGERAILKLEAAQNEPPSYSNGRVVEGHRSGQARSAWNDEWASISERTLGKIGGSS